MFNETIIIVGPGGIGKSPLSDLFGTDIILLDPYRLRKDGPRDNKDKNYANPNLWDFMDGIFEENINDIVKKEELCIIRKKKILVLFFKVRNDYQILFIRNLDKDKQSLARLEIYAPILKKILEEKKCEDIFGKVHLIILNPLINSYNDKNFDFEDLKRKTRENCKERGDSEKSINDRIDNLEEEWNAWKKLIEFFKNEKEKGNQQYFCYEYKNWQFAEFEYKNKEKEVLDKAREKLVENNTELEKFFKIQLNPEAIKKAKSIYQKKGCKSPSELIKKLLDENE
ncbi:MAG: hypothetical protein ACFFC3_15900 [Candidatus Odinarchaeota archaeon]